MCWSATVEMGVLFIGRCVAYCKMGLHRLLFISTIDLLQPPWATVQPPSTSSSLHLRLFIHRLLFIQPPPLLHRLLFNQPSPWGPVQPPSTGYCSSSPPWGPVHPALHGVLFIHPQPARSGSCSSSGNGLYYHGVMFIQPPPHRELFIQNPQQRSMFIQRQHRSASVSSSSEGITRGQLTARDRSGSVMLLVQSLGFS